MCPKKSILSVMLKEYLLFKIIGHQSFWIYMQILYQKTSRYRKRKTAGYGQYTYTHRFLITFNNSILFDSLNLRVKFQLKT